MQIVVSAVLITAGFPAAQNNGPSPEVASMKRMGAAATLPAPDDTKDKAYNRFRLAALVSHIEQTDKDLAAGRLKPSELLNLLTATRDLVAVGVKLSPLPEEALCWHRVGLDLTRRQYRIVKSRLLTRELPSESLIQPRAQVELFLSQHTNALERCLHRPQ